ncbi:LPXTG cell wall anchor domain-containing protein [Streptomyces millisiae]|uniref:LPXTG cell wall anchor domain-containing protein n=1 Tax=Streptomyces millisiae TaxID=3075542 RepID=A0ABU2LXH2_9ACTN|nr:LPXTG cell wall anchor domain-containing protein [Streptomyces sp. DSM 44918]MDT0322244.1 LPXTG cell wall anchor domain-containing protein [Streptomyces sp. DSM 44918]
MPFTTYRWGHHTTCVQREQAVVSPRGRGHERPVWEMIYHHYVTRRGLSAPSVQAAAEKWRAEGGGGDYGPDSGGYDQLGFGTLAYTREPGDAEPGGPSTSSTSRPSGAGGGGETADAADSTAGGPRPQGASGGLAATGSDALMPWAGASGLLALVAGGLLLRRRRQGSGEH